MIYQETENKNYIDDVSEIAIGTLRSDNGDANKNVDKKKIEFVAFQTVSRFFQVAQLRQSRETMSERERAEGGGRRGGAQPSSDRDSQIHRPAVPVVEYT